MGLVIQGNLLALNAANNSKINTGNKAKRAERLSSGYRINRAADDAAGLSISEKMRRQIRGLDQGARNAQDGVSFAQVGDGSLNEVDDMIHRMTELSVKAANGTLSQSDRADIQAEFRQLQVEIDHVTNGSIFNETHVFSEHEPTFHCIDGNKVWDQGHTHVIDEDNDTLSFTIQKDPSSPEQTFSIRVKPHGNYTTAELNSAIDDALISSGAADAGVEVVYKMDGTFDISLEGGQKLKSVDGGLSYLLYDMYNGASTGALIGTTIFTSEDARLNIEKDNNDNLSFDIIDFSGNTVTKNITLTDGYYTRQEIIDMLNDNLKDTSVKAVAKGTGIKLETNEAYITRFKGNMFKIEESIPKYTSVFYDNVKYGEIYPKSAVFTGGKVLDSSGNSIQSAFSVYNITSDNNTLSVRPDGGDTTYNVTIPNGEYTADQMAAKLNELFSSQGVQLTASVSQKDNYSGLVLTAASKGVSSDVGVVSSSSAYHTLFTDRNVYNGTESRNIVTESKADTAATFTSGNRDISEIPLNIEAGKNDRFKINDGSDSYTITLTPGIYSSAGAVASEINTRIAELSGLNGRVSAQTVTASTGSAVSLVSPSASNMITNLTATAVSGNSGYSDIFVGKYIISSPTSVSGRNSVTTRETVSEPVIITSKDTSFQVRVGNNYRPVTIPEGTYNHDQIVELMNNALKGYSGTTDYTFNSVSATGATTVTNVTSTVKTGETNTVYTEYSNTGYYEIKQGSTASDINIPATITVNKAAIPANTVINNDNNQLKITLDNVTKEITLDNGVYNRSQLVSQIQSKLDSAYAGLNETGATVGLSGDHLTFTSKLGAHKTGNKTSILLSSTGSSFIKDIHTTNTPGTATSNVALLNTISIDGSTKDFTFTVNGNTCKVEIPENTYTRQSFAEKLSELITSKGAQASVTSDGKLMLSTTARGAGYTISYNSGYGDNTSADKLFGPRTVKSSASVVAGRALQQPITIASPADKLRLKVDGTDKEVTLATGTYTNRQSFVNMVNECLSAQGAGATAFLNGTNIGYCSNTQGDQSKIAISYDSRSDSAMKSMYGSYDSSVPTVTASFDASDHLVLSSQGYNLYVTSTYGSVFQNPDETIKTTSPTSTNGYKSSVIPYAEGSKEINFPVSITKFNNKLSAVYKSPPGTGTKNMNILIDPGTYNDIDSLVAAVKSKVDAGGYPLVVSKSSNGANIKLSATGTGSTYSFDFSTSPFYNIVMNNAYQSTYQQPVTDVKGSAASDTAYVVGRKDIRHRTTVIEKNTNDELTLDLTINNNTTKLSIKLDEGSYSGESLVSMIQKNLDKALEDNGFDKGFIQAALGEKNTGVEGANDANALDFILNPRASFDNPKQPQGSYVIDGVGGSAAFQVFYQTDGEMIKAYSMGPKNISQGVTISDDNNSLGFTVDGVSYELTIPSGKYSAGEIKDKLQELSEEAGAPVNIRLQDGRLKIEHKSFGKHAITGIKGSARQELFFNEKKEIKDNNDITLQMSSESRDIEEITRRRVDSAAIKINGCCLTNVKNARKTIGRLEESLHRVSDVRSYLGAKQNRLEHAIKINNNTSENTTAAESRIRDADMALEMLQHTKSSILEQVSEAMLSQANKNPEMVLGLLK